MITTVSDSLRFAEDQCNVADVLLSQDQKSVFLVTVAGDQIAFDDPPDSRIVTSQRVTIADGYRAWTAPLYSPYDGYLYPRVLQSSSKVVVQSHGQLGHNTVLIGSLVLPYNFNGIIGGYDPLDFFQPKIGSNANLQVYIRIFGFGLPSTANYYTIKDIMLSGGDIQEGISFKVVAEANGLNIGD